MAKMKRKTVKTQTFEATFDEFIISKSAEGIKDKTLATYRQHLKAVSPYLPVEEEISTLTERDLEEMIVALKNKGLSPSSIRAYTATIKSFLSWCANPKRNYTQVKLKLYKAPDTVKETYTDEELVKLLAKPNYNDFAEYRNWVIVNLLLNCGCRAATIRHIQLSDVNLDEGMIRYRHTKNGSVQMVPLCSEMRHILKGYIKAWPLEESGLLFPNYENKPLSENGLSEAIRRYNRDRGVEKTSIHLFRHTYAERYLMAGGSAFNLQKILGHSTLAMTKHYCNIYNTEIVKDFDRLSPLANLKRK